MKFDWGKGIVAVFILFVAGMSFMVYKSVTKDIDLVTPNYYEKEIKYQEQINRIQNSGGMTEQVKIEYTGNAVVISYPEEIKPGTTGEINFYRPSNAKKDFRIPIEITADRKQVISSAILEKGLWKLQLAWIMNGKDYYKEEKIMIQ